MFQGQRLSYLVPGYTGHIPHKVYDNYQPLKKSEQTSKIPGYAGYVQSIKPQNLYANTFGKITYDVATQNIIKGQDYPPHEKYVSTQCKVNIPPSEMLRRTAADIVGVPNKTVFAKEPKQIHQTGKQIDQFTLTKNSKFRQSLSEFKQPMNSTQIINNEGKQYVQLGNPVPGYTGFQKRVLANNIFGKTFAECRNQSLNDADKLLHDKNKNLQTQLSLEPPLKF